MASSRALVGLLMAGVILSSMPAATVNGSGCTAQRRQQVRQRDFQDNSALPSGVVTHPELGFDIEDFKIGSSIRIDVDDAPPASISRVHPLRHLATTGQDGFVNEA